MKRFLIYAFDEHEMIEIRVTDSFDMAQELIKMFNSWEYVVQLYECVIDHFGNARFILVQEE